MIKVGVVGSPLPWCIGICMISLCAVGCGSSATVEQKVDPALERLKIIARAYIQATRELEHPPQNASELMPYLKSAGDPAEILRSPNDGQDFKILWGVDLQTIPPVEGGAKKFMVLAYEKQGRDGKRWVGGFRKVRQMTEEEFREAPFPPGHMPPQ
jgi:hypothetical protein